MKMEEIKKNGKTFVIVPKNLYEGLAKDAEMLHDIKLYDSAKMSVREYYPAEILERLLKKESPIKTFRNYRGFTQEQLAKRSGISREMITMIETGSKTGSVATLKKLANALKVSLDEIA